MSRYTNTSQSGRTERLIAAAVRGGGGKRYGDASTQMLAKSCTDCCIAPVSDGVCASIRVVEISEIAIYVDGTTWRLIGNTTIGPCEQLNINGIQLSLGNFTLMNRGIVNVNNGAIASGGGGTLKNTGLLTVDSSSSLATITIYNYSGGQIVNNGIFIMFPILHNADGTGSCGTGTISGLGNHSINDTNCPPS